MANCTLPAVALLALADGVKLGMLPASHKIVSIEDVNGLCQPTEFQFKVGEIIIFHPLFVHYGCSYTANEGSLRVHFYFDNDQLVRADGNEISAPIFWIQLLQKFARCQITKQKVVVEEIIYETNQYTVAATLKRKFVSGEI